MITPSLQFRKIAGLKRKNKGGMVVDMETKTKVETATSPRITRQPIPRIWGKVAGMLKGRRGTDALRYQQKIRNGWEKRLKKLVTLR